MELFVAEPGGVLNGQPLNQDTTYILVEGDIIGFTAEACHQYKVNFTQPIPVGDGDEKQIVLWNNSPRFDNINIKIFFVIIR